MIELLGAGLGLLGSMSQADAMRDEANAKVEAARIAAEAAKFKPFSLRTGFGRGFFDTEAQTAGYELDPRLAEIRDFYYQQAQQAQEQALAADPEAYAAKILEEQQQLLDPLRRAEDIKLRQEQLNRGRIGLGVSPESQGFGMLSGAVNPEQLALQLARARADAERAAAARTAGIQEQERLQGRPATLFTSGAGFEELGMKPLEMGAQYGGKAAIAGAQAGELLSKGLTSAAQSRAAAASQLPALLYETGQGLMSQKYGTGLSDAFGGLFNTPVRSTAYLSDPMTAYRGITNFNYGLG